MTDSRDRLDSYKKELAVPEALISDALGDGVDRSRLADVVSAYKPTALIGASGQAGAFDEDVVKAMAAHTDRPIILPMSNPTSISEGTPEMILRWSNATALVATGSPFDDVPLRGETRHIGQANNVFVFPGLGLGTIASRASEVTDGMISASSAALAEALSDDELKGQCLMPEVNRLWDICGVVGQAVATQAVEDGVAAPDIEDVASCVEKMRWVPEYPELIEKTD